MSDWRVRELAALGASQWSSRTLQSVIDRIPCQVALVDRTSQLLVVNDRWRDVAETHPEDFRACRLGDSLLEWSERCGERELALALDRVVTLGAGAAAGEVLAQGTAGQADVRVSVGALDDGGGAVICCWAADPRDLADPGAEVAADPLGWPALHERLLQADALGCTKHTAVVVLRFTSASGDAVPEAVARAALGRVSRGGRAGDLAALTGPGEVCVVVSDVLGEIHGMGIAERLLGLLTAPMLLDDAVLELTGVASVTMAAHLRPLDSPRAVLERLHLRTSLPLLHHTHVPATVPRTSPQQLDRALAGDEFFLLYQPIVAATDGALVGSEALVRWMDPIHGIIPPDEFIPDAELTGRIVPLGTWVLEQACRDSSLLNAAAPVSINVSARQLTPTFVTTVLEVLERTGLPPRRLTLEITESLLMLDTERAIETLQALTAHGVRIAIDDFGAGYSSLGRLRDLTIHRIKIDRIFVRELEESPLDALIIEAVVNLAHTLSVDVVAEGVETIAQAEILRDLGCDHLQGYLFSPPVPMSELRAAVARQGWPNRRPE